jgi:hypothetical protein
MPVVIQFIWLFDNAYAYELQITISIVCTNY